jgi:metallophosphoesterase (TIGR00282 family)
VRILFIGDIVGRPGRQAVKALLPSLRERFHPDAVVANAENAAGGFGLTAKVVDELFGLGVDALTTGNHVYDKREVIPLLAGDSRIVRPLNYTPDCPGRGAYRLALADGVGLWVVCVQGKVLMPPIACPFRAMDTFWDGLPAGDRCVLVDVHAEATSEKRAMGFYLDGRAGVVVGTHTHVPTADAEILPGGTGYLTDAGMTGPYASVIGTEVGDSTRKILTGMPTILNVARGDLRLAGLFAELEGTTGRCTALESFVLRVPALA